MAGVGITELVLLFVIGLLILGPERLPRVASQIGRWVGKARRTANQLRFQMEREIALAEIDRTQSKKRTNEKSEADGSGGAGGQSESQAATSAERTGDDASPDSAASGRAAGTAPGDAATGAEAGSSNDPDTGDDAKR